MKTNPTAFILQIHRGPFWGGFIKAKGALLLSALILALPGCSSLSARVKEYCRLIDVQGKGRTDALRGLPEASIATDEDFKKCLKYGAPLDYQRYKRGYAKALKEFCTAEKGLEQGQKGVKYHNICPKELEADFLKAYKEGDKKCLFISGNNQAMNEKPLDFTKSSCQKLSGPEGEAEHKKGWKQGRTRFCSYDKGYDNGLMGEIHPICVLKSGQVIKIYHSGYKKGLKKCYFEKGYMEATNGKTKSLKTASIIGDTYCRSLKDKSNRAQYNAGWSKGIKDFCSPVKAYEFGSKGGKYQNTCPKAVEDKFFKSYIKGVEEHKAAQRQKELLYLQEERMRAEERDRQRALQLQRERIRAEQRDRQRALDLQEERIYNEERNRQESLNLQRENLRLKKLRGYQLCRFDSDCRPPYSFCRYNSSVKERVCR